MLALAEHLAGHQEDMNVFFEKLVASLRRAAHEATFTLKEEDDDHDAVSPASMSSSLPSGHKSTATDALSLHLRSRTVVNVSIKGFLSLTAMFAVSCWTPFASIRHWEREE